MQTDTTVTFSSLALCEPIQRAIADKGYTHPSPIQAKAIPHLLAGKDLIGLAQTGTGKTAAFSLPILERLSRNPVQRATKRPRALILTPTRELAIQIGENIALYGRHVQVRHTLVYGGVGEQPQIKSIAVGTDILVATPGRLLDLMAQRHVFLDKIEVFVLDEADRMLDMGFAPDVKRVIAQLPKQRQSLLFSATMPDSIRDMAEGLLHNPETVEVAPVGSTVDRIEQRLCYVAKPLKQRLLAHILTQHPGERVLVFARTKHGADRIARNLARDGFEADAIHGDKGQGARQRALNGFRDGSTPVLVATDIAARGIDVKEVSLVINYDLPEEPEAYVHRIGRTARAGASGQAIAFCDEEEKSLLRDIQRLIRKTIQPDHSHPFAPGSEVSDTAIREAAQRRLNQPQQGNQRRQQQHPAGRHHQQGGQHDSRRGGNRGEGRSQGRDQGGRDSSRGSDQGRRQDGQDRSQRPAGHSASQSSRAGGNASAQQTQEQAKPRSPLHRFAFWKR